ncbi:GntR family transcriptional regulator [Streptomyces sp. NPDC059567]|uniref:GntR family transcriptional regulator n=1 Tax=Streptomyces sp. NPDC059567 TaxID=3346867 RepID=UPI00367754B8
MSRAATDADPLYMRVADQILREARSRTVAASGASGLRRIPSERLLSASLGVNRQTVRRALEHLRTRGLVRTDRSGTYVHTADNPSERAAVGTAPQQLFPGGADFSSLTVRSRATLSYEPVPPPVEALLGLDPDAPTLVHRHRIVLGSEEVVQQAVSYFSPTAIAHVPGLSRRVRRIRHEPRESQPDLRHLYVWMAEAGLRPVRRDRVWVNPAPSDDLWLHVRQLVHDQHNRLLEVTDFRIDPRRGELGYEFRLPDAAASPAPPRGALQSGREGTIARTSKRRARRG